MSRDGKSESSVHAARIALHRCVDEWPNLGETHNRFESRVHLALRESEDRAAEKRVLPARQLRVKTCPHFEQSADRACDIGVAGRRPRDAREDAKESALSGAG